MSISSEPELDRADWTRFGKNATRCIICGHQAAVSVTVSAKEITGKPGGGELARNTIAFCHTHGIQKYADALNKLK